MLFKATIVLVSIAIASGLKCYSNQHWFKGEHPSAYYYFDRLLSTLYFEIYPMNLELLRRQSAALEQSCALEQSKSEKCLSNSLEPICLKLLVAMIMVFARVASRDLLMRRVLEVRCRHITAVQEICATMRWALPLHQLHQHQPPDCQPGASHPNKHKNNENAWISKSQQANWENCFLPFQMLDMRGNQTVGDVEICQICKKKHFKDKDKEKKH